MIVNGCLVMGDKLYIYVSGWVGKGFLGFVSLDVGGSMGLVIFRCDGFVLMDIDFGSGMFIMRFVMFVG